MKLYNQKRTPLRYDNSSGVVIQWEPYGAANVPDELVPALKQQGFPVSVTPVAPEVKAVAVAEDAASEQRGDAVEKLKAAVSLANAEAAASKKAAEEAASQLSMLQGAVKAADAKAADQAQRAEQIAGDLKAAHELLTETSKKLETAEARVLAAEAERDLAKADVSQKQQPAKK